MIRRFASRPVTHKPVDRDYSTRGLAEKDDRHGRKIGIRIVPLPDEGIYFREVRSAPLSRGLLLNGNLLARFQRASVERVVMTPGIASLNPGLMSVQPFRAAGLHAGGVKEISPR